MIGNKKALPGVRLEMLAVMVLLKQNSCYLFENLLFLLVVLTSADILYQTLFPTATTLIELKLDDFLRTMVFTVTIIFKLLIRRLIVEL